jgi:hypothetical protein
VVCSSERVMQIGTREVQVPVLINREDFVLFVMEVARPDDRGIRYSVHVVVTVETLHVSCCPNVNCGSSHA